MKWSAKRHKGYTHEKSTEKKLEKIYLRLSFNILKA